MTATLPTPDTTLDTPFTVGGREFRSRLMVGTGKYHDNAEMVRAIEASGAEIVTVAVRRVDLDRRKEESILHHLSPERFFLLANTAGCYTPDEAVRYADQHGIPFQLFDAKPNKRIIKAYADNFAFGSKFPWTH